MSSMQTRNYITQLSNIIKNEADTRRISVKKYVEFLTDVAVNVENKRFPRIIAKVFKEIKEGEDPSGLKAGEVAHYLNNFLSLMGRIIFRKTGNPRIFIVRFSTAEDFAAAIHYIPNRAQGYLFPMRLCNNEAKVEEVDFTAQDYIIKFLLRGDLSRRANVAQKVAEKVGKVLTLVGPLNNQGEFHAHVVTDISRGISLTHDLKVIIVDPNDRGTVKVKIFFSEIHHGTCFTCWKVDNYHTEEICKARRSLYNKNCPKVYVYNEDEGDADCANQHSQGDTEVEGITDAAGGIRIFNSQIDREDNQRRGIKRRRIDEAIVFSFERTEVGDIGDKRSAINMSGSSSAGRSAPSFEDRMNVVIRRLEKGKALAKV